jgi:O-antigen/teichoic acid export membrane protein
MGSARISAVDESSTDRAPAERAGVSGKSVALNSTVVAVAQAVIVGLGLVLTPFIVGRLGLVLFGLYGFVTTTVAFISVLDPGLGLIVIRYASSDDGDQKLAARLSTLGLTVWLSLGIILSPLLFIVLPVLTTHLHSATGALLSPSLVTTAQQFFVFGYVYLFITAAGAILGCRLIAAGEQWLVTVIGLVSRFVYAVVVVVVLISGFGIWGLAMASSAQTALVVLATLVAIWRRHGTVVANPFTLGRTRLVELLRFGGLVQLSSILDALNYDTDPIIIGRFVSVGASGLYQLANRAAGQIAYLVAVPQQSLLQTFSAVANRRASIAEVRRPAVQASRYLGLVAFFAGGALLAAAPELSVAWLGKPYDGIDGALCLLAGLQLVNAARFNSSIVIVALGKAGIGAKAKAISVAVNLALTLALVVPFGLTGVLIGTMVASALQTAVLMRRYTALLESNLREVLWQWYAPGLAVALASAAVARLVGLAIDAPAVTSRGPAILAGAITVLVFSACFSVGIRATRYLNHSDLDYVSSILPQPIGKVLHLRVIRLLTVTSSK